MQRIVIDVPDGQSVFFLELVKKLGLERVKTLSPEDSGFVDDVAHALREVELHQQGKITLQTAKDFLNEL